MSTDNISSAPHLVTEVNRLIGDTPSWGTEIKGFRSVGSTNAVARTWATEGAPEGSIVIADYQTEGRGRLGRSWTAAAGRNLLFSIVLRPNLADERRGLVTLAASVAVADTLESITSPYVPTIKWPNDIILDGHKCCGMLLETAPSSGDPSCTQGVILGIGLNVNQITFPPPLEDKATSLRLVTGRLIERAPLFVQIMNSVHTWYERLLDDNGGIVREAFEERMLCMGERVTLRYTDDHSSIEGIVDGIDDTGGLRLRQSDGFHTVHAGEVTVLERGNV